MIFRSTVVVLLSLIGSSLSFVPRTAQVDRKVVELGSYTDYLSSLAPTNGNLSGNGGESAPSFQLYQPSSMGSNFATSPVQEDIKFSHAPLSYFDVDKLTPKGPRKNADVGQPHDATRKLVDLTTASAGSWWCDRGGWPSPTMRTTTEIFFVISGHGCITDMDGKRHFFGPGDTVVLPKGWSGRWDIMEPIHKVWCVNDHARVEETSSPIRAMVSHYNAMASHNLESKGVRSDAILGSPSTASSTFYDVGPQCVGYWTCTPGSFPVKNRQTTEFFHVVEGLFFLTNDDGTAIRCGPGDTVVLPKGWSGIWDVIDPVRKLWVVVED